MKGRLNAIPFEGLNTDCLGNYLAALGVISAIQERWQEVRAFWKFGHAVLLVPSALDREQLAEYLLTTWQPTAFRRWWDAAFKEDKTATKGHGVPSALSRGRSNASLEQVRVLDATVIVHERLITNPLLGPLAGKVSDKRNFENAHLAASQWIATARTGETITDGLSTDSRAALKRFQKRPDRSKLAEDWLAHTLFGTAACDVPQLAGAGTWFGVGNRSYNNGQEWYREGQLSPWSVLFAMQGVFQLVGGVNRRLGTSSRPYAVFPFMSDPARPETESDLGLRREGEFWAPLWSYPAARSEIRALFQRGLAKLGVRSASAPHEFAVAALEIGVDGGVAEFARFELRQTTSSQVYESIPRERVVVPRAVSTLAAPSSLLLQLIESRWIDRLPRDTVRPRRFFGLRGPIEAAIVKIGEHPDDALRWQELLLLLANAQSRIDRNKELRKRCLPIPLLSSGWISRAWPTHSMEIAVASAIASVGWHRDNSSVPLLANIFGVNLTARGQARQISFPETRTAEAVWGQGDPIQRLLDVAQRRLVNTKGLSQSPFAGTKSCPAGLIRRFLSDCSDLDLEVIAKWISPLSLIDWSQPAQGAFSDPPVDDLGRVDDGTVMLHALVRPFFHRVQKREMLDEHKSIFRSGQLPKVNLLRRLLQLLRFGEIDEAIQVLRDRYLAVGRAIVMPPQGLVADGERIAAALLIPMSNSDVETGLERWLQPSRNH